MLVHVTVLPTLTVNVAGANAKLSMLTSSPPTTAGDPVVDAVPAGALGIEGIPLIPGIPGVALAAEPKVTDGIGMLELVPAVGREAEHPANNSTPTASTAAKCFRSMGISMPRDSAVGYTT